MSQWDYIRNEDPIGIFGDKSYTNIDDIHIKNGKMIISGLKERENNDGEVIESKAFFAIADTSDHGIETAGKRPKDITAQFTENKITDILNDPKTKTEKFDIDESSNTLSIMAAKLEDVANRHTGLTASKPDAPMAAPANHGMTTLHINKESGAVHSAATFKR